MSDSLPQFPVIEQLPVLENFFLKKTLAARLTGSNITAATLAVTGTLTTSSSHTEAVLVVTANTTLSTTHRNVVCNPSAAITITLPAISGTAGRVYDIKNKSNFTVTIQASGAELVDGFNTLEVLPGSSYTLKSDGTVWNIT